MCVKKKTARKTKNIILCRKITIQSAIFFLTIILISYTNLFFYPNFYIFLLIMKEALKIHNKNKKIDRLVENITKYSAEKAELDIFETF